jgi:hypothetical protein
MKLRHVSAAMIAVLGTTGAILLLEGYQTESDWLRALERTVFLWLGFTAAFVPVLMDELSWRAARRRRHRHVGE